MQAVAVSVILSLFMPKTVMILGGLPLSNSEDSTGLYQVIEENRFVSQNNHRGCQVYFHNSEPFLGDASGLSLSSRQVQLQFISP